MIPKSTATMGQVLRDNGYLTSWFGKNHNTPDWESSIAGPFTRWPTGMGFDYFYGFIGGETHQYYPVIFENTKPVEADIHGSGMLQHDHDIGLVLDWLDQQGLADNTIVWYSTDNGPEHSSWPHGATTPFRGEKMTTYEGGVRVISMVRWPGVLPKGVTLNGIQAHQDMFTTLAAAAGIEDVNAEVMKSKKQYIDGVNNLAYWKGDASVPRAFWSAFYGRCEG